MKHVLVATLVCWLVPVLVQAADLPAAPATQPAAAPTTQPTLLATVGNVRITSEFLDKVMAEAARKQLPPEQMPVIRQRVIGQMIFQALVKVYVDKQNVEVTDKDLKDIDAQIEKAAAAASMTVDQFKAAKALTPEQIKGQIQVQKVIAAATSTEKVNAFLADHPSYFNGTTVQASHILIKMDAAASSAEQKEAYAKIQQIAADIKSNKISFEDAARKYSACPSAPQGGDLGEFTFERMVPTFAMIAFDAKIGEVSDVVRTQFGFHLVKVTKRTDGKDKPSDKSTQIATNSLAAMLMNQVLNQALDSVPVVLMK